jgi:hypothetical protein
VSLAPKSRRQMSGAGGSLAHVVREREGRWQIGVCEAASEAARRGARAASPGAGRDGRQGRGEVGEDRAGQQRQCRAASAGLWGRDGGACDAEHLLGGQRGLLDRPAVEAAVAQSACGDGQRGREHRRLGPARVADGDEPDGRAVRGDVGEHRVVPPGGADDGVLLLPGHGRIRGRRRQEPVPVRARAGADRLAPPARAATARGGRRDRPATTPHSTPATRYPASCVEPPGRFVAAQHPDGTVPGGSCAVAIPYFLIAPPPFPETREGYEDNKDRAKHEAAERWVKAVNHWGDLGRWAFHVCKSPTTLRPELEWLVRRCTT